MAPSSASRSWKPPSAPSPPLVFIVVGPGGVGKGTVIRRLLERDDRLWLSRSWTTRPRRPGEAEDAYHFVDKETFLAHAEAGGFLEWAQVLDDLYGTPVPAPPAGKDLVLEIDVQGARQVLALRPDALCILLLAPTGEDQEERLRARGDSEDHVRRRLALGEKEVAEASQIASEVVVNDDVEAAVARLAAIIDAARAGASRP